MEALLTCEDVLHSIGDNEVLIADETVDRLLVALGDGGLSFDAAIVFSD
jgi:hypothetical protein